MPKISVVLPVFNGEKYLAESIESVIKQSFVDWELIIVDDCSTDSSPSIIEKFSEMDSRIRVIHNKENKKLPESLNIGFRVANGDYFTWTSDDNIFEPSAFLAMYTYLLNHDDASMVVADMVLIDENGSYIGEWKKYDRSEMAMHNVVGACFLYRSEAARLIGEYNADLYLVEDYDYWLRLLFASKKILRIENVLYRFRVHSESLSESKSKAVQRKLYELRVNYLDMLLNLAGDDANAITILYCEMVQLISMSDSIKKKFDNALEILSIFEPFNAEKRTIIYGAGNYGNRIFHYIDNVAYYVDADSRKVGSKLNGIDIISLSELSKIHSEYQILIAINCSHVFEVAQKLKKLGIESLCTSYDSAFKM